MDLQPPEGSSQDDDPRWRACQDVGMGMNADGQESLESPNHEQVIPDPDPGLPNLSRCAACYNHKKNVLYGGDGESSSSAGDSGPELDRESEAESLSSSSSSSEDEPEEPSPPAGSAGGGEGREPEDEGKMPEGLAEGTTQPRDTPPPSVPAPKPASRPDTVTSTLLLQVLPQDHASDAFCIIQQHPGGAEERGGEQGGACHLPPPAGWLHPPPQLPYHHHHQPHPHTYQMFPQHFPPVPAQGQRLPPALRAPPVLHRPPLHGWPPPPSAAQTHLDAQFPHQCWCCDNRGLPPFVYQNQQGNR